MEVVRIIDLKDYKGVSLMESETNSLVKEAVFYLNEKTKDMTDEQYIEWLKKKRTEGFTNIDRIQLGDDLFQNKKFLFLKDDYEMLPFDILTVISIALDSNGFKDKEYKHLIDTDVVSN